MRRARLRPTAPPIERAPRRRSTRASASRAGFTLVELMVAVGILAVLVSLAVPNLQTHVYRAGPSEAIVALNGIYKAELSYHSEMGVYGGTFDSIGFDLSGAQRIDERTLQGRFYTHTIQALAQNEQAGANFQAVASGNVDPRDAVLDILMIENDLTIVE